MKGRILQFNDSGHRNADLLLPWFVNGTLEGEELARVERHVADCSRCQRELQRLRDLRDAFEIAQPVPTMPASYPRLQRRASARGDVDGQRGAPATSLRRGWERVPSWARWVIAAQWAAVFALGAYLVPRLDGANLYHTLGATSVPAGTTGNVVVVFDRRIAEAELRRILRDTGAVAIDLPTHDGAYVLHVPNARAPGAIDRLRKEPAVVLVERIAPEAAE